MLVEPNSVCQLSIGSTFHSLRVFLRVKNGLVNDVAEKEFTEWLSGRDLQTIYDSLKSKIASTELRTYCSQIPYSWYRDAAFVAWLLDTGQAVDATLDRGSSVTILIATCVEGDDGNWIGQVRPFGRHSEINSYADMDVGPRVLKELG